MIEQVYLTSRLIEIHYGRKKYHRLAKTADRVSLVQVQRMLRDNSLFGIYAPAATGL